VPKDAFEGEHNKMKRIKDSFWIGVAIVVFGFFIYKVVKRYLTDHIPNGNIRYIKAVTFDDRNYMGNQPVHAQFSFSYYFIVDRKKYTGNSHDTTLGIGDTVEVEYDKNSPSLNKPLHPKE
jgi:hypothetical protein